MNKITHQARKHSIKKKTLKIMEMKDRIFLKCYMQNGETFIRRITSMIRSLHSEATMFCCWWTKSRFPHRPCRCGVDNASILAESKGSSCGLDVCFGMRDLWYYFLYKFLMTENSKGVVQLDLSIGDLSKFWSFVKLKFDKSDSSTNLIVMNTE